MYTETYADFQRLLKHHISSIEIGKIKSQSLNKLFDALSKLGIQDKRTNLIIKSLLTEKSSGKRVGYSTLNEVHKYFKNLRKSENNNVPLREICSDLNKITFDTDSQLKTTKRAVNYRSKYLLRSSCERLDEYNVKNSERCVPEKPSFTSTQRNKVLPSVPSDCSSETSTVQENSKNNFLEYFGLANDATQSPKPSAVIPNLSMSTFKKSTKSVAFSSELGRLLAKRVNHHVSEEFKLRKIERLERYINRPCTEKIQDIEYPVTYVDKTTIVASKSKTPKTPIIILKPLSIQLKNEDLVSLQRKIQKMVKSRKKCRTYRLRKKCREFSILLTAKDRLSVQRYLNRKKRK